MEKRDFPEVGALLGGNPSAPKFSPRNCATFFHFVFWPTRPTGAGHRKIRLSGPFWPRAALGTWRNCGPKTEKRDFRELGEKYVLPKSFSQKLRNLFTFCAFADRTPSGGEIAKKIGLGRPLTLREIPGQKRKNTISRT